MKASCLKAICAINMDILSKITWKHKLHGHTKLICRAPSSQVIKISLKQWPARKRSNYNLQHEHMKPKDNLTFSNCFQSLVDLGTLGKEVPEQERTFKFQWIPIQGSASSGRNDNLKDRDSYIPRNHPGNHSSHHQEHSEQITVDTRIPIVAKKPQLPPREEEQRIIQAEPQVAAKKDSNE